MATRDFKVRNGLEVGGDITYKGGTITVFDSDSVINIVKEIGNNDSDLAVVAALREDVDSDSSVIQSLQGDVDILRSDADSDSTIIQQLRTDHDTLNQTVSGHTTDIQTINNILDSDEAAIESLKQRTTTLESRADSDEGILQSLTGRVDILETNADSDVIEIGHLRRDADSDASEIARLRADADSDSAAIQALQTSFSSDITTLQNRADSDETAIQSLSSSVGILQARADSDEIKLQALDNDIKNLQAGALTDSDLSVVADLRDDVDSDSAKLQTLEGTVATIRSDVDSDSTVIQQNTTDIAALRADVDSDSTIIQDLQTQIDNVAGLTDSDLQVVADLRNDLDSDSAKLSGQKIKDHNDVTFGEDKTNAVTITGNTLTFDGSSLSVSGRITLADAGYSITTITGETAGTVEATYQEIKTALAHRMDSDIITFNEDDSEAFFIKHDQGGYRSVHPSNSNSGYASGEGLKLRLTRIGTSIRLQRVEGSSVPTHVFVKETGSWPPSFGNNYEGVTEAGLFNNTTQTTTTTTVTDPTAGQFLFYDGSNWVGKSLAARLNTDSDSLVTLNDRFETYSAADSDRLATHIKNADSDFTGQKLSDHADVNTFRNYYDDLSPAIPTSFYFNDTSDEDPVAFSGTTRVGIHSADADASLETKIAATENAVSKFHAQADLLGRLDSDLITFENNEGMFLKYSTGQIQVVYPVQSDSDYDTGATFRFYADAGNMFISSGNGATATHFISRWDSDIPAQQAGSVVQIGWADVSTYAKKEIRPTTGHFLKWDGSNWVADASQGITDSDLAAIADLRNDVDSDSVAIQQNTTDIAALRADVDSDTAVIQSNTGRIDTLESRADSDEGILQSLTGRIDILETNADSDVIEIGHLRRDADSDASEIAKLRADADSDSAAIQALQESFSSDITTLQNRADSDETKIQSLGSDIETIQTRLDSDETQLQNINTRIDNLGGSTSINVSVFTFTATNNEDSDFSGADDNGQTLSYVTDKIHVYLNGILQTSGTDYIATDGSTVTFIDPPDSDDTISIVKYLGTVQAGFDSDQVVAIIGENTSADVEARLDSDELAIQALRTDIEGKIDDVNTDYSSQATFTLDEFATGDYRSVKYFISADSNDSSYMATEVIVIHDDTNAYITEYGTVSTHDSEFITLDADISGGNVRLRATPTNGAGNVKAIRQHINHT